MGARRAGGGHPRPSGGPALRTIVDSVPDETAHETARTAARDQAFQCDAWSCVPTAKAPLRLATAWNLRRPLKDGRLDGLCQGAEVVILRNDTRPAGCHAGLMLTGADFAAGGSAELHRAGAGWRVVWAQDLRGRRPWTWGPDPRGIPR